MHHLLLANNKSNSRTFPVIFSSGFKRQAHFWFSMIRLCSGRGRLPNPFYKLPSWAVDVYTDSAGGSMSSIGLGAGAVTPGWWTYLPWSRAINLGRPAPSGRSLSRSMSALELVGPLAVLAGGYPWCKNNYIRIWVDNAGSFRLYLAQRLQHLLSPLYHSGGSYFYGGCWSLLFCRDLQNYSLLQSSSLHG